MTKLKFDLAQDGLLCVLKPYQAEIMRFLWETGEPQDSRMVYNHLQTSDVKGARSRAAIINFLNDMVNEGFLNYEEKSTKGGMKRVYRLNSTSMTEEAFKVHVVRRFLAGLSQFEQGEEKAGSLNGKFIQIKKAEEKK